MQLVNLQLHCISLALVYADVIVVIVDEHLVLSVLFKQVYFLSLQIGYSFIQVTNLSGVSVLQLDEVHLVLLDFGNSYDLHLLVVDHRVRIHGLTLSRQSNLVLCIIGISRRIVISDEHHLFFWTAWTSLIFLVGFDLLLLLLQLG